VLFFFLVLLFELDWRVLGGGGIKGDGIGWVAGVEWDMRCRDRCEWRRGDIEMEMEGEK